MFNDVLITTAPNGQLFVNGEREINWKQAFLDTYTGGDNTPEIRHNARQDSPYLGRDSNRAPTE
jgi:hypothetical protein